MAHSLGFSSRRFIDDVLNREGRLGLGDDGSGHPRRDHLNLSPPDIRSDNMLVRTMHMMLGFGPIRRHLILLLTIASAVLVWPSIERSKLEDVGFGHSQPWHSDQSTNAVIEIQAEIDSAEDFAGDGGKIGLASHGAYALLAAPARLITADGLLPSAKLLALFPNKTGPPSV